MTINADEVDVMPYPSLGATIVQRLQRSIVNGEYSRGEHLRETELAELFKVSRGPVRDALQVLDSEGWVEIRPRIGAFVRNPTQREVDEFFHVKGILETETARLAASVATEPDIESLRVFLSLGRQAVERKDTQALADLSTRFHSRLAEMCGNTMLIEILRPVQKRFPFFFTFSAGPRNKNAWVEHEALVDAVSAGDPDRAAQIMREHSDATRASYHDQMATDAG